MKHSFDSNTRQLVTFAKKGDELALNQLCSVYAERVKWMVRFRMNKEVRSKMESMDLVQEVMIHVLRGLGDFTYENEGDFVRWLSKIAENAFYDNLDKLYAGKRNIRREARLDVFKSGSAGNFKGVPGPIDVTTPSSIMSKREDLVRLEKSIDKLKPKYREVIILAKIEQLSYNQIGEKLGVSAAAVKMLVSRAIVELAGAFGSI
ncbi:MAG: sigma-70 family RNA polymerase sigma factor [Planctomycetota bacterium]